MLHLAGHNDLVDLLFLEDFNQPAQFSDRDPVASGGELFDLGRCLIPYSDRHYFIAQFAGGFERKQRKSPAAGDHPVPAHFTNPRSEAAIKASNSSIAGPI